MKDNLTQKQASSHIKSYWSSYTSIIAICCSSFVIITQNPSTDGLKMDYIGVIVGILSLLVTIILGWQIWSVFAINKKIDDKVEDISKQMYDKIEKLNQALTDNINKTQDNLRISGAISTTATLYKAESISLNVCLLAGKQNYRMATNILSQLLEYAIALNDPKTLSDAAKLIVDSKAKMDEDGIMDQDYETICNSFLTLSRNALTHLPASDVQVPRLYQMASMIRTKTNHNYDSNDQ